MGQCLLPAPLWPFAPSSLHCLLPRGMFLFPRQGVAVTSLLTGIWLAVRSPPPGSKFLCRFLTGGNPQGRSIIDSVCQGKSQRRNRVRIWPVALNTRVCPSNQLEIAIPCEPKSATAAPHHQGLFFAAYLLAPTLPHPCHRDTCSRISEPTPLQRDRTSRQLRHACCAKIFGSRMHPTSAICQQDSDEAYVGSPRTNRRGTTRRSRSGNGHPSIWESNVTFVFLKIVPQSIHSFR